jgi:hypothetical protein
MNKILSHGLAVFAGVVSLPVAVSPMQFHQAKIADYRRDPRLERLREFFGQDGCPAASFAHVFLEAADNYELDWRLLPSIAYLESTGGKLARGNNFFGWDSGRTEFSTPAAGIHMVAYRLTHSRLYRDKSLDKILEVYNPGTGYARKVKSVMRRISASE